MDPITYIDRTEPDSPTATPTASSITPFHFNSTISSPFSQSLSLAHLKQLGRDVYKAVWDEFYAWEPAHCADTLATLPNALPASKRQVARVAKSMVARLVAPSQDVRWQANRPPAVAANTTTTDAEAVCVAITHLSADDPSGRRGAAHAEVPIPVVSIDAYPPHPTYESCTPASRSVLVDDSQEDTLRFVPYADDDRFPVEAYQAQFDVLEWETPFDPDEEMIQIETVKRLRLMHGLDVQDIDRMGMFKAFRFSHNTGLQWDQSQRDALHWPGAFKHKAIDEELLPNFTPDPDDLRQRLMSNLRVFCPSINCLHSICETHGRKHASSYIPSGKPQFTGKDMILSEGVPCGAECFRHIQDFEKFMDTLPPSPIELDHRSSLDTLATVIGIAPDLFPCQLAVICLKPCRQVFVQRLQLFPDHTILSAALLNTSDDLLTDTDMEETHPKLQKNNKARLEFVDGKSNVNCELVAACAHPGSCTTENCVCYAEKQHCTLMCRCGIKCVRQWKGCSCPNERCASRTSCSCAKKGRECTPGICISCNAGGEAGRPCDNTRMQCLATKPIEVKCGSYGLGAFACQSMNPGTFIGSYVGHILTDQLGSTNIELAKHISLNYMFEITPQRNNIQLGVFDAAHLGNATRFLNHATDNKDNVDAKTLLVNGEHQIGFFTKRRVRAGEELLLDYGDNYWRTMPAFPISEDESTRSSSMQQ